MSSATLDDVFSPLKLPRRPLLSSSHTATPHVAEREMMEEDHNMWRNMNELEVPWTATTAMDTVAPVHVPLPATSNPIPSSTSAPRSPRSPPFVPLAASRTSSSSQHNARNQKNTKNTKNAPSSSHPPNVPRLSTAFQVSVKTELKTMRVSTLKLTSKSRLAAVVHQQLKEIVGTIDNEQQQSYLGRIALDCLNNLIVERKRLLKEQQEELQLKMQEINRQVTGLNKQEIEMTTFIEQEQRDVHLDVEYKSNKRQQRKLDVLIPLNQRGRNKPKTHTVGFGATMVNDGGSGGGGGGGGKSSELGIETQRQRVRTTRTQLMVARIVGILHQEEKERQHHKHHQHHQPQNEYPSEEEPSTSNKTTPINATKNIQKMEELIQLKKQMILLKEDHQFEIDELSTVLHEKTVQTNQMRNIILGIRPQLHQMGEDCFNLRQNCEHDMQQYYNWSTKELAFMKYVSLIGVAKNCWWRTTDFFIVVSFRCCCS